MENKKLYAKALLSHHTLYTKWMFENLEGTYIPSKFDLIFGETINKVFTGEIKRLIINMPPSIGKTGRGVIALCSMGFAINPQSRFLHISYSNDLVKLNSATIKGVIQSDYYQNLYPNVQLKKDTFAKNLWETTDGGRFKASPSGGSVTGFRAGLIGATEFSGALIIDDPLKPDDATSDTKREFINNRYENTFKSRLADANVPVIIIMQRVHSKDFTNHILEKYGKEWTHLKIPALVDDTLESDNRGVTVPLNINNGSILPLVYPESLLSSEKILNPTYYNAQLQQNPHENQGTILSSNWVTPYITLPKIKRTFVYGDTANKTGKKHDYTVFMFFALGVDNKIYILDMVRGKWEFQDLVPKAVSFWKKCKASKHPPITFTIEDKASGISLIQVMRSNGINVVNKPRSRDKMYRVSLVSDYLYSGVLCKPTGVHWVTDLNLEFDKFTDDDTHAHDDIIDCCVDVLSDNIHHFGVAKVNINNVLPI